MFRSGRMTPGRARRPARCNSRGATSNPAILAILTQ
jgi:hypothetical protein